MFFNIGSRYNIKICDYITENNQIDGCYISNARNNKNKKVCDLITNNEGKQYCYGEIKRIEEN